MGIISGAVTVGKSLWGQRFGGLGNLGDITSENKFYFDFDGRSMQSGTYLYNISGSGISVTKKIVKLE